MIAESAPGQAQFWKTPHPFVWTSASEREAVLAAHEDPLWQRFLEEADRHFASQGHLNPPKFPVFCHDGDLDEVMAVAALANVRGEARLWGWVAEWLRAALAWHADAAPRWQENQWRILRGEPAPGGGNPRQYFEGFTKGGMYWVEAGLMSVFLHLLDLLEAYAPESLAAQEKLGLLAAVAGYAERFAFHEEAVKYNNRALWANAAILLAGMTHPNANAGELLRLRAERRNAEFRTTFFDDGFHAEGAPDYHIMSADGLLAYHLPFQGCHPGVPSLEAGHGAEPFGRYPSFVDILRAYLGTVEPGPVLWNHPRGCSISAPLVARPALVQAWRMSRDPELGWFLKESMGRILPKKNSALPVTNAALLGLGHYQPLLNFWIFRPVDAVRPPKKARHLFPDYGEIFSRSGWHSQADCVTARFGYEGTGKGHRDFGHVTATVGGQRILKDPFPRFGPRGLESGIFHNTLTLDQRESGAVIGTFHPGESDESVEAFLLENSGGSLPDRLFLHDPRDESQYWFAAQPGPPDHQFLRAVLHIKDSGLILVDRVVARNVCAMDWFFHSDRQPAGYEADAAPRRTPYQLKPRHVLDSALSLDVPLRGAVQDIPLGCWGEVDMEGSGWSFFAATAPLSVEMGHWMWKGNEEAGCLEFSGERDFFLRIRACAQTALGVWVVRWPGKNFRVEAIETAAGCVLHLPGSQWKVDFARREVGRV